MYIIPPKLFDNSMACARIHLVIKILKETGTDLGVDNGPGSFRKVARLAVESDSASEDAKRLSRIR